MSGFYIATAALGFIIAIWTIVRPAMVEARYIEPWERALFVCLITGGIILDVYAAVHL